MQCLICKTEGDKLEEHIFACPNCKTNFSDFTEPADYADYEKLYPGMKDWCVSLKTKPNAWRAVINRGEPYSEIMKFFMNEDRRWNILDVGCGYGYMVYVLSSLNFAVKGIDISREAINFAQETYSPDWYENGEIEEYRGKHDIIISVEVFEHLAKPKEWLRKCLTIAPRVMITTPNMQFYKGRNWISEPPPIHMACYCKGSLEWITKDMGIKVNVDDSGSNLIATFYES